MTHCHDKEFKCLVATTGEEGLDLARQPGPQALLLDIHFPGMDGWEVLDRIKGDTSIRHIPVHVMSVDEPSTRAFRKGASGMTIVQDPETAQSSAMPRATLDRVEVQEVLPPGDIATLLSELATGLRTQEHRP